jgi:hypothetical protein
VKAIAAVVLMLVLGAAGAGAEDIKGKWGISAGVFGGGGEASLFRGKSDRSAWLFDLSVANVSLTVNSGNSDNVALSVGPGYRRFLRVTDGLSPYWDLAAHFLYNRQHGSSFETAKTWGGDASLSFGLEYFTPWHFSIAADSEIVGFSWTRNEQDRYLGTPTSRTGHTQRASIRLSPVLYVRGYF